MAASLAGLYGGGYGASQEDGSGGRSGFFARGQKKGFVGCNNPTGAGGQQDQTTTQQQHGATDSSLIKE